MTIGCSRPDSSRYVAPSATEYLVPSLKMLPISMTFSTPSGLPHSTHASPAVTAWRSAKRQSKSRPALTPQVEALAVRADDVDAVLEMLVGEHRHPRADGTDRPCRGAQVLADLVGMRGADLSAEGAAELPFVER